jgi:hypothetical protein
MTSRLQLVAGVAGAFLAFGVGTANATITDTYSLSQWEAATGDSTGLTLTAPSTTIPGSGVSFGAGTGTLSGSTNALNGGSGSWGNNWSIGTTDTTNANYGAAAKGAAGIIEISGGQVTFNVSNLSAFGFFMQTNTTVAVTYSITEYSGANGTGTVLASDTNTTTINDSGATSGPNAGTGASFFGFYGDITGAVESVTISLNPTTQTAPSGIAVGQFFEVAANPVPEPASVALVGFGLAALGMVRRRKRG